MKLACEPEGDRRVGEGASAGAALDGPRCTCRSMTREQGNDVSETKGGSSLGGMLLLSLV